MIRTMTRISSWRRWLLSATNIRSSEGRRGPRWWRRRLISINILIRYSRLSILSKLRRPKSRALCSITVSEVHLNGRIKAAPVKDSTVIRSRAAPCRHSDGTSSTNQASKITAACSKFSTKFKGTSNSNMEGTPKTIFATNCWKIKKKRWVRSWVPGWSLSWSTPKRNLAREVRPQSLCRV